jgi:hypothetical protein
MVNQLPKTMEKTVKKKDPDKNSRTKAAVII